MRSLRFLCLCLGLCSAPASAVYETSFGVGLGVSYQTVSDSDGDVDSLVALGPVSLLYQQEYARDRRYSVELSYASATFDPEPGGVGQDVSHYSLAGTLQFRQRHTFNWQPWWGVGLGIANDRASDRYKVTNDGYLDERLSNADRRYAAGLVFVQTDFDVNLFGWDRPAAWRVQYQHPFSDGLRYGSFSLLFFY
ncbi:outer membrane beta-barrel protein [Alkalilimnicola ehrlichii]|uniref:outer membrane beta-barrel protein n=1 Tax=Alkalilimnicola ehrlichii TaxID=351052 RepID=UPI0011C0314E|nr:outer membrane beta-barrel protein [Alkalilimnicola ehrlichii]